MGLSTMIAAVACSGQLALTLLAFSRSGRSTMVSAFARLCAAMFGWTFAALMHDVTRLSAFHVLDVSLSPLVPALAFDFVARFTQRVTALRAAVRLAYAAAFGLSLLSLLSPVWTLARHVEHSAWWGILFAVIGLPALGSSAVLLWRHASTPAPIDTRFRAHVLLAALLVGTLLGVTELVGKSGWETTRLGALGTLLSCVLMSIAVLRLRLLDRNPSLVVGGATLTIAALVVITFASATQTLRDQPALLVLVVSGVTGMVAWVVSRLTRILDVERAHAQRLVFLGRAADQMAHDLHNPIAALKGALQVLSRERESGRAVDAQHPMFDLATAQVERVERLVARYRRLGRVTPERVQVDVAALCDEVVRSQRQSCPATVEIKPEIAPELPRWELDPELMATVLDNVIRNSVEAFTSSGRIDVQVDMREEQLTMTIADNGPGMAPDVAARAFDDFYTTKAEGSGLGLPFVRRVIEAHGGHVSLQSTLGRGTCVELKLPKRSEAP